MPAQAYDLNCCLICMCSRLQIGPGGAGSNPAETWGPPARLARGLKGADKQFLFLSNL